MVSLALLFRSPYAGLSFPSVLISSYLVHRTIKHPGFRRVTVLLLRIGRLLSHVPTVIRMSRVETRLFDAPYYLRNNPDVGASWMPPFLHFLMFGAFEGRKPNPLFDPGFYYRANRSTVDETTNPLLHFLITGAAEGRSPHPLFGMDLVGGRSAVDPVDYFLTALAQPPDSVLYSWWLRREGQILPPTPIQRPIFTVLLEASHPKSPWLDDAIASLRAQTYPHWELFVCRDGAEEAASGGDSLDRAAAADSRIRLTSIPDGQTFGSALNRLAAAANGQYLVLFGQQDRMAPNALQWLATAAPADLIYGDEDRLEQAGGRTAPVFKPDWSPDLLLSCRYTGGVFAISRAAWDAAGGGSRCFDRAKEYDLLLRVTAPGVVVRRVPHILVSRRISQGVQDSSAERQCLVNELLRRGASAEVEDGPVPGTFRPRWQIRGNSRVSVIICSRSASLLDRCLSALARQTDYPIEEMIVVQHVREKTGDLEVVTARHKARGIAYSGSFHFSRMNNVGAGAAKGEVLLFLNDDTEPLDRSWLGRLVGQVEREDVGISGARLLYPSGSLQHAGVAIGIGDGCGHPGRNFLAAPRHWPWLDLSRDVSAVTGACLAIRAEVFREVGGFAEEFPVNYNDIDLCLRVRQAGYRVVYESGAVLRHYECQTRRHGVITDAERALWRERWGHALTAGDPFYSPNLTRECEDLSYASPATTT